MGRVVVTVLLAPDGAVALATNRALQAVIGPMWAVMIGFATAALRPHRRARGPSAPRPRTVPAASGARSSGQEPAGA